MKTKQKKADGGWTNLADGIKARFTSVETVKAEHPELSGLLDEIQPITTQVLLNGYIMRLEQYPLLKNYFGDGFTLRDIKLFYQKNHFDFTITNWDELCSLIGDVENKKRLSGETPLYAIEKKPDFWVFHYQGKTATVRGDLKALPMIEVLLQHPNDVFAADALRHLDFGKPVLKKTIQKQIENPEVIRNSISLLEDKYDKAAEYEKNGIQEQIDVLKNYLKQAMNKKGQSRNFSDNGKDRVALSQNYKTLLEKIKSQNRELYNHLKTYLKISFNCRYCPDKEIFWEIS